MDTLFNTNFENFESSHFEPQVKLRAQTYDLQESNVRLRLTVVNTVGFGDQMNKEDRWEEACDNDNLRVLSGGVVLSILVHVLPKSCLENSFAFIKPRFLLCFSYQPVVDYIDKQFESYLQEELKIKRSLHNYHDSRVHACLYFISPSGHSLKSLDLVTMKKLDSKVRRVSSLQDVQINLKSSYVNYGVKLLFTLGCFIFCTL